MPDQPAWRQEKVAGGRGSVRAPGISRANRALPGGWAIGVVAAGMLALTWGVIGLGKYTGRAASDQLLFHEPTVRMFARQWPRADLSDYLSATSPGYHLALALVARFVTDSRMGLQFAGALFTAAMAGVLVWACLRELRSAHDRDGGCRGAWAVTSGLAGWRALWVCMPMLASVYVFLPGVWLLPDNAGWLMVLVGLVLAQARLDGLRGLQGAGFGEAGAERRAVAVWWCACAATLVGVVFVRQSHVWVAGAMIAAAYARVRAGGGGEGEGSLGALFCGVPRRLVSAGICALAAVPAVLVLMMLVKLWGGLVPPRFQGQHASANPTTPALALTLLAVHSVFFAGFLGEPLRRLWREGKWVLIGAAAVGVALAAVPVTTYVYPARGSGIWGAVKMMEDRGIVIAGRTSPLLLVLSPLGAVALCGWIAGIQGVRRWVMLSALCAFVAAQTANANAWQRYLEPGLLMFVAMFACWGWGHVKENGTGWADGDWRCGRVDVSRMLGVARWAGPLLLTAVLATITAREFFFGSPMDPKNPPPMPPEVGLPAKR